MGALLPLPVFGIASRLFNRRVGFIAAMITLLHPLLGADKFVVFRWHRGDYSDSSHAVPMPRGE